MIGIHSLLLALSLVGQAPEAIGTIEGTVINRSQGDAPVADAEVVLQVQIEGQFTAVEKTTSDADGKFSFESLPVGRGIVYLPGASRDGIHYPGRRIELTSRRKAAYLTVPVQDVVTDPSPLIVRQHEVVMRGEPGVLHVVEGMLVDNPGKATYVGHASEGQMVPVTFRLGIPSDFARLTFEEEFFGRNFHAIDGQVVTDIPWTPGQRWVRFTYSIPNEDAHRVWERKLDVPCDYLRIRVQHERPEEISSNLPSGDEVSASEAVFESTGGILPSGHMVQVTLGHLPRPWTVYARWWALAALLGSVAVVAVLRWPKRSREVEGSESADKGSADAIQHSAHESLEPRPSRGKRRRRIST